MMQKCTIETLRCSRASSFHRYSYSISATQMDPKKICSPNTVAVKFLTNPFINLPSRFIRNVEHATQGLDIGEEAICRRQLTTIAHAKFILASQIVTQTKRDVRVSFADTLSNFGGTLGLFTGMSLVSMVEALFWILRLVGCIRKRKDKGSVIQA